MSKVRIEICESEFNEILHWLRDRKAAFEFLSEYEDNPHDKATAERIQKLIDKLKQAEATQ